MKTNLPALAIISWMLVGCDAQVTKPTAKQQTPNALELGRQEWLEGLRKQSKIEAREKEVAAVRADLAAPWSILVVALRYDCSCTGTSCRGFCIRRDADTFTVTPWSEYGGWSGTGLELTGESRLLSKSAVERLLSEAALFYLAATFSESVIERVGPRPTDSNKQAEWRERYLAAGGSLEASDRLWIDIRVVTPEGLTRHSNMWESNTPLDFSTWIAAFGEPPRR